MNIEVIENTLYWLNYWKDNTSYRQCYIKDILIGKECTGEYCYKCKYDKNKDEWNTVWRCL